MNKMCIITYPKELNKIFCKLQEHNSRPVIVGGFVRDAFLKIESKDIDIEVYNVSSFEKLEKILQEFGSVNSVGKSFGVCKLHVNNLELDFTLPRLDNKLSSGHKGFDVKIKPDFDFIQAASRRDFTINAIGYDVINQKILDPFNGIKDLKNKILKAVDKDSFIEDPLRVLRAVQFCARFCLTMDKKLFNLCKKMIDADMLKELSKERIFQEMKKLLLKSQKPSIGFEILKELNALKYFPQLKEIQKKDWVYTLLTLDKMTSFFTCNENTNLALMLSILCINFDNSHDFSLTKKFIKRLSNKKELLEHTLTLVKSYPILKDISPQKIDNPLLYKLASKVNIEELLLLNKTDYLIKNSTNSYKLFDIIKEKAENLNILNKKAPPFLQGKDILKYGITPSREYSNILNRAYEAQMNEEFNSYKDAIIWLEKYLGDKI